MTRAPGLACCVAAWLALPVAAAAEEPRPPSAAAEPVLTCEQIALFLAERAAAVRTRDAAAFNAPLGPVLRERLAGLSRLLGDDHFEVTSASSAMHKCDDTRGDSALELHWTMVLRLKRDGNPEATRHVLGEWIRIARIDGAIHAELLSSTDEPAPPEEHQQLESAGAPPAGAAATP